MSKIKIKNFGPIKEGYQDDEGWINIKKVTVFIGNQGTGKSSVTKLISTMTWLEQALVRGNINEKDLSKKNRFNKHISFQNIHNYFKDNTEIAYVGKAYSITFMGGSLTIDKSKNNGYQVPKIMYVPAERNFVAAVSNVRGLKGLPSTLYTFSDEFVNAAENLKDDAIVLPINTAKFEYQRLNKIAWISGDGYKIRLSEASSGFQSFVPLFLVTRYLAMSINAEQDASIKSISIEEERRIRKGIEDILLNAELSEEVKRGALELLSARFKSSCFINIVEEPEQNLFPTSQRHILNSLLEFTNRTAGNGLIITTHSPYIINYLTLSVKAKFVQDKIKDAKNKTELATQLEAIVPSKSIISSDDLVIYELDDNGSIVKLGDYKGLPSDENYLNERLAESNELFSNLLDIEDQCQ